jgi:hypothetical protein
LLRNTSAAAPAAVTQASRQAPAPPRSGQPRRSLPGRRRRARRREWSARQTKAQGPKSGRQPPAVTAASPR